MKSLTRPVFTGYVLILAGLWCMWPAKAFSGSPSDQVGDGRVEDIYVARSVRESRASPSEFCGEARTGSPSARSEDRYTFRSTATRGSDGLMIDAGVQTIGRLHACFGSTPDPALSSFYAEGVLGTVTFTGRGECRTAKRDYPESGMAVTRCFLELSGLPEGYVGGQLTTNTINSRNVLGDKTDPPGYTQASIATIRLWKRR